MYRKYMINSKGLFTGFLNLTIDNAPIIPNERAKFEDITHVITKTEGGNKIETNLWCIESDDSYLRYENHRLIDKPKNKLRVNKNIVLRSMNILSNIS